MSHPSSPEPAVLPARLPLRAASWNVQSCLRGIAGVAELLRSAGADVVALQEVDCGTGRAAGVDQAALLAEAAGLPYRHFFPTLQLGRGQYGIALLSRWPLVGPTAVPLPTPQGVEPRALASAGVLHPGGELAVYLTHLSHRVGARRLRGLQAGYIAERLVAEPRPRLLLGDFNDLPGSPMHRALSAVLVDTFGAAGEGPAGTHPIAGLLPLRIDYAFASRDLLPERVRVLRTRASDHHLLLADLLVPACALAREASA